MPNFDKNQIPVAVNRHTRLDLSCEHITTMNIGVAQPVYYRHMFKGEKIDISSFVTCRPAPIQVPVYGSLRLNSRAFFVPWRVVFPQFDSFYTDTIGANYSAASLVTSGPVTKNSDIWNMFTTIVTQFGPLVQVVANAPTDPYDMQDGGTYYAFTTIGRKYVKVLWSLGYRFSPDTKDNTEYSLLPLLAYAKIYLDWYANQNYLDSSVVLSIKQLLSFNDPTSKLTASAAQLNLLLSLVVDLVYPSSYFTAAWDNPVAPVSNQQTLLQWSDPTTSGGAFINSPNGRTPEMFTYAAASPNATPVGTEYMHRALKLLTDYTKRNQLSGALEIDRWLSKFGVATDATRIQRSIYLGSQSTPIQIGDVTSTANTAGSGNMSNLGDYAGKGFGQGKNSWEFSSDEFGILIVIASIMPSAGYFQGLDRNLLHIQKTDFYQPEFDGLSTQAISRREVYVSKHSAFGDAIRYNGVFGYTGRYGEMKRPISWVTGDIALESVLQGGDSWHLMRQFDDAHFGNDAQNINHSLDFTRTLDWEEYNRIFQYTNSDRDHFFVDFKFGVSSLAPCRPLFDTYDFEEFNKEVTLSTNGSKFD